MSLLVVLGGGAVGSFIEEAIGKFSGIGAIVGILGGLLVLVFWAAYRLRGQLDEIEQRPRPHFIFEIPAVSTRVIEVEAGPPVMVSSMFNARLLRRGKRKTVNFVHIKIANHPLHPAEACDSPATVAHLTYLHEKSPISTQGRWGGGTDQPGAQPSNTAIEHYVRMDFPANGERHELDLAIKHPADDHIYAYDNDSQKYGGADFKLPKYELFGEQVIVEVELLGSAMVDKVTWRFVLHSLGKGKGMTIEPDTSLGASGMPSWRC